MLAFHTVVRADGFGTGITEQVGRIAMSVHRLGAEMLDWVRAENRGGRNLTEIGSFKAESVGTHTKPIFALKDGETNVLFGNMSCVFSSFSQSWCGWATYFECWEAPYEFAYTYPCQPQRFSRCCCAGFSPFGQRVFGYYELFATGS